MILLEHTAGQGSAMGASFEEIAAMLDGVKNNQRVWASASTRVICWHPATTCAPRKVTGQRSTRSTTLIGFDRLKVFHLNDSKKPCMSRVDRHEHIGKGCIGLEPFRRLVNDQRFAHLPMILETEKTEWRDRNRIEIDPLDEMNLNTLRSC